MLKNNKVEIHDQYTDKSGAVLVKIAGMLTDERVANLAIDTLFSKKREMRKTASFPTNSAQDVFLSRVYFEGQKDKMEKSAADNIDKRLCKYEALYGIRNGVHKAASLQKTASFPFYLLPLCKIASKKELVKAGNDFSEKFEDLDYPDRLTFANNFVKAAELYDADIPDSVKLYSEIDVEANPSIAENVFLRKIAMQRKYNTSAGYDKLYDYVKTIDTANMPVSELHKLACAINEADVRFELRENRRGRTIPDAWHSVFVVKTAEESENTDATNEATPDDADSLTKADIISRYGEGILEEVENEDGTINRDRLKELLEILNPLARTEESRTNNA